MQSRTDARRERRLPANTPVAVKLLGLLGEPTSHGRVLDMSGSGLRATVPLPIPCGAQVRVNGEGMVIFGQIVRCQPSGAAYTLGVSISHVEASARDLASVKAGD